MTSEHRGAETRPSTLCSAQRQTAEAGFTLAQARLTLSVHNEEEGGSRGKHGFPPR